MVTRERRNFMKNQPIERFRVSLVKKVGISSKLSISIKYSQDLGKRNVKLIKKCAAPRGNKYLCLMTTSNFLFHNIFLELQCN